MQSPKKRPVVAVTGTVEIVDGASRVRVNEAYTNAILGAGMIPLVVPPSDRDGFAADVLDSVDGLLLTGGEDVDPRHFGATPHPATNAPNAPRDECELELARLARDRGVPTLAICRGVQLMNVACGGTLVQDIPSERAGSLVHDREDDRGERVHEVNVEPGSKLATALGATSMQANSFHHQSVDRIGEGLRVTATAPDGIVEGIESSGGRWWMVGVQWHPEELTKTVEVADRKLFDEFAAVVREGQDG